MKKIFLLFFLLLGVLSAWGAYNVEVDGIYYNLDTKKKTASVTRGGVKYKGSVVIPESIRVDGTTYSVTSLGARCFYFCPGLISITIPNSVTSLGDGCFYKCRGLTSITIPNSVKRLGYECFADCSGLTSITIPNSVTSLGWSCFAYCSGLTSITIPNSVTSLGDWCFSGCSGLTSITIPNSVTSLGARCFYNCWGLTEVHVNRETPPTTGGYIFYACGSLQTIYVPTGASANYEVSPWNAYKIVEEDVQSGIRAVMAEGAANAPVYHLNGRRAGTSKNFSTLPKGIYIVNGKKVLR